MEVLPESAPERVPDFLDSLTPSPFDATSTTLAPRRGVAPTSCLADPRWPRRQQSPDAFGEAAAVDGQNQRDLGHRVLGQVRDVLRERAVAGFLFDRKGARLRSRAIGPRAGDGR